MNKRNVPVDSSLPDGVVETVEEVQEHGSSVARGGPISRLVVRVNWAFCRISVDRFTSVSLGVFESTSPNNQSEDDEGAEGVFGTNRTPNPVDIHKNAIDNGTDDLGEVVEKIVQGLGAGIKVGTVDAILLVGSEPVGGPEHREQENNERLVSQSLPKADELRLPAGMLHQNNLGSIRTDDILGVAQKKGNACSEKHKDNEGNVGTIANVLVLPDMDILSKRNLAARVRRWFLC